jgi:hypothetical protein
MYKKFSIVTVSVATSLLLLAATAQAADEGKRGSAKGAVTDRTSHCEAQVTQLALTGDAKTAFLEKCQASSVSEAEKSAAASLKGTLKPN